VGEIKLLFLITAVGNISLAILVAGYSLKAGTNSSIQIWAFAKASFAGSMVLYWLRPALPYLPAALSANGLMILGTGAELAAFCVFLEYRRWKLPLGIATLASEAIMVLAFFTMSVPTATMLMSLIIGSFSAVLALIVLRRGPGSGYLRGMIGLMALLSAAGFYWRAHASLTTNLVLYSPGPAQSMTFLGGCLLLLVGGFGFLLLCKEKEDRRLRELAGTDSVTGLLNKQRFARQASASTTLAIRLRQPVSLIMIGIDHTEGFNKEFGRACVQQALRIVANCATANLRDHDVIGRLDGEEFAILLPGTDSFGALQVAERVQLAITTVEKLHNGRQFSITVSIGVVEFDRRELVGGALVRAERALLAARACGGNRIEAGKSIAQTMPMFDLATAAG
jgi:diguanylate cyclase (GGDEF)-like protein